MHATPVNQQFPELKFLRSGKVRDVYEVDEQRLLIVASDRISAFDCILPTLIPGKGVVLTQISKFWFDRLASVVPHHLLAADVDAFPTELLKRFSGATRELLSGRSMLVARTDVIPFECVVRGYLAGSGWKDYQASGAICGHALPPGLVESAQLPEPIFTPATKSDAGHDINVSVTEMARVLGEDLTRHLEAISLQLYEEAARYAEARGIIICDTKFEFGFRGGELLLIDEIFTPDSSRFWPREHYQPGRPQPSFDKQFVRDYLETLAWNKQPPAPALPPEVADRTGQKYLEAYRLLTGSDL